MQHNRNLEIEFVSNSNTLREQLKNHVTLSYDPLSQSFSGSTGGSIEYYNTNYVGLCDLSKWPNVGGPYDAEKQGWQLQSLQTDICDFPFSGMPAGKYASTFTRIRNHIIFFSGWGG